MTPGLARAAVRTGPNTIEMHSFPIPEVGPDAALLKVEVAGICGTDVKMFRNPRVSGPVIMGHENIGTIADAGQNFLTRNGLSIGDRVFVEHYVGCFNCEWCHRGEYRHCWATDWRNNPSALRFGYTSAAEPPHLWGGFADYMYLPWNSVIHRVPEGVSPELAGIATPMSNGIEWALFDCGVGYGATVLIQGPGQQGLSQIVACRQAGASLIIVTGTSSDAARLAVAGKLGADFVFSIDEVDVREELDALTAGAGVDVVLDCTSSSRPDPILLGVDALKRRGGTILIQGNLDRFDSFPIKQVTEKGITIKSARGHSYQACELALEQLDSRRFPLELLLTHTFGLTEVDQAIAALSGSGAPDVIHAAITPGRPE